MHLSASLPIALVLMLKRSCLLAIVGNRCLRGRRANELSLCSYPCLPLCSANTLWNLPIAGRTSIKPNPFVPLLIWNERESLIGILIMPMENFWPEFFHRTCSPFGCLFSRSVVRIFPDCWISLNRSLIFV